MKAPIIVPLDGTMDAEAILQHSLFFALQTQSTLLLLRVIMPPGEPEYAVPYIPDDWYEGEVSWTKNYLNGLARRLEAQGVRVQTQHVEGTFAGAAISAYAEQHTDVELIALATHGRSAGGRLLLGSVARDVYASAPTSLLLLHSPKEEQITHGVFAPASYHTIMVPLDGTAPDERAIERATTLALDSLRRRPSPTPLVLPCQAERGCPQRRSGARPLEQVNAVLSSLVSCIQVEPSWIGLAPQRCCGCPRPWLASRG